MFLFSVAGSFILFLSSCALVRVDAEETTNVRGLMQGKTMKMKMMMKMGKGSKKSSSCPTTPEITCPTMDMFVRFATFNVAMNRAEEGDLKEELAATGSGQPSVIAETIQRVRPDVVLINEFDYDDQGEGLELFVKNYLGQSQNGADPIEYPYVYSAPSNTGIASGTDLDNDGEIGGPNDAFGFGFFPGQYGMAFLSMYPIDTHNIRTFQYFLWKDMPCALLPTNEDGSSFYSKEALDVFRLSSKSHWDIPVHIGSEEVVHVLASHPTPPVFDGPEDRNGKRNHDEIRFWADYITGGKKASYIYDDNGHYGGLYEGSKFVIAGDLNSDPYDGDSYPGAAQLITEHPLTYHGVAPYSMGGIEQAKLQGQVNDEHCADPRFDTADFNPAGPGNLRADYCLPSANMDVVLAQVFWPLQSDPLFPLVGTFPFPGSDHRMVYIDVMF